MHWLSPRHSQAVTVEGVSIEAREGTGGILAGHERDETRQPLSKSV
jgi:hypothetical protein